MSVAPLQLRPLALGDEDEARASQAEFAPDDFEFLLDERPGEPWPAYVARMEEQRHGRGLAPDRVPATFRVAEAGGRIVGRVSVRHVLNDDLAEFGGHIGYGVRPWARRRGHATAILREALVLAREAGVEEALLTCDEGNAASVATIERCGGRFERLTRPEGGGVVKRRYWIAT